MGHGLGWVNWDEINVRDSLIKKSGLKEEKIDMKIEKSWGGGHNKLKPL